MLRFTHDAVGLDKSVMPCIQQYSIIKKSFCFKSSKLPDVVVYVFNSSTQKAETRESVDLGSAWST